MRAREFVRVWGVAIEEAIVIRIPRCMQVQETPISFSKLGELDEEGKKHAGRMTRRRRGLGGAGAGTLGARPRDRLSSCESTMGVMGSLLSCSCGLSKGPGLAVLAI